MSKRQSCPEFSTPTPKKTNIDFDELSAANCIDNEMKIMKSSETAVPIIPLKETILNECDDHNPLSSFTNCFPTDFWSILFNNRDNIVLAGRQQTQSETEMSP
jgi:hypothetical protein